MLTVPAVAHMFISVPAAAVGNELIVIVLVDEASAQAIFEAVSVKITLPAAISAILGV